MIELMPHYLTYYALAVSVVLALGETIVVLRTQKYRPLSYDDYLVCALLTYCALTLEHLTSQLLMLTTWGFMAGNLYAMLFTRMDPNGGTRERLGALAFMLLLSLLGIAMTIGVLLTTTG